MLPSVFSIWNQPFNLMKISCSKSGKKRWIKIMMQLNTNTDSKSGSTTDNMLINTTLNSMLESRPINLKWINLLTWPMNNSQLNILDSTKTLKPQTSALENKPQPIVFQLKLTGLIKALLLQSRIKDNADHVGLFQPLVLWKELIMLPPKSSTHSLNNN